MNGKVDTHKNLSIYRKTNEVGITISKLYFLDFFKWNDSPKRLQNIPQTKPSAKISPDREKLGDWFNW